MRPIFCILHLSSDDSLAPNDPVGWVVQDGTSAHGVTASSGVVTLPSGYHWFSQSQVIPTALTTVDFDWYIDSVASTTFAETGISLIGSGSSGSNCVAHCYIDAASASVDLELRAAGAVTADADFCFMLLIGYPT